MWYRHVPRSEREKKKKKKKNKRKNAALRAKIVNAFIFCVCGRQKPEDPRLSLMIANDDISRGGLGGLASLVYICGGHANYADFNWPNVCC